MPQYEYACPECGGFTQSHPLAAYADPQPCPICGTASPRALTSPAIGSSDAGRAEPMAACGAGMPGFAGCPGCPSAQFS